MITYRPEDLGRYVRPPAFSLWTPPPALIPYKDPYLIARVLAALRRL